MYCMQVLDTYMYTKRQYFCLRATFCFAAACMRTTVRLESYDHKTVTKFLDMSSFPWLSTYMYSGPGINSHVTRRLLLCVLYRLWWATCTCTCSHSSNLVCIEVWLSYFLFNWYTQDCLAHQGTTFCIYIHIACLFLHCDSVFGGIVQTRFFWMLV